MSSPFISNDRAKVNTATALRYDTSEYNYKTTFSQNCILQFLTTSKTSFSYRYTKNSTLLKECIIYTHGESVMNATLVKKSKTFYENKLMYIKIHNRNVAFKSKKNLFTKPVNLFHYGLNFCSQL